MSRITLKELERYAQENTTDYACDMWFDTLISWSLCGRNMIDVFNRMSKKDTLKAIAHCVEDSSFEDKCIYNIYCSAMTSLENRL